MQTSRSTAPKTVPCAKCNATGTFLHFGPCFDCRGTGRRVERKIAPQTTCSCRPGTWCFLPRHNFDVAFGVKDGAFETRTPIATLDAELAADEAFRASEAN